MQVQITGKKIEVGEALRQKSDEKIHEIVKKYDLSPLEGAVTFSRNGPYIRCDIEMHLGRGVYVRANNDTEDAHISLDQAAETFEKRLRRYKKKLIDHTKKRDVSYEKAPALQYVINAESEQDEVPDNPLIIAEMKTEIPTLSVSEAVMHLDLGDTQAVMFKNSAHNQLNVVYRRSDGNIGWISPNQDSGE